MGKLLSAQVFQGAHERLSAAPAMAVGLHGKIQLVNEGPAFAPVLV